MTAPAVLAEDLSAGYGGPPVLRGVSFAVDPGRTVCVLGPNGGGKTTLFRALLGELQPDSGIVRVAGRPAYVAQTERTRLDFPVNALDVALMGALAHGRWWPSPSASCPADSASAPSSPAPSSRTPACCSSTSRSRASTPPVPR